MDESQLCKLCGTGSDGEYELRVYMTEGGHRDISIRLCDLCAEAHLEIDGVERFQAPTQSQ
jgi:DUF1680 family protein